MTESRRDKWYAGIIRHYGSIEAWQAQQKIWASKGGKKGYRPFRENNDLARTAGRKGGLAKARKLKGGEDGQAGSEAKAEERIV